MKDLQHFSVDFHPEVWSPTPGHWDVNIGPIDNGWVNNPGKKCEVPYPYTTVQEDIRLHEAYHVLISGDHTGWGMTRKMMEEIRVDAYAYHRGRDMDFRHDLCVFQKGMEAGTKRNAAHWICQFTPTAFSRLDLDEGKFLLNDRLPDGIQQHVDHAFSYLDENEIKSLGQIVSKLWQKPTEKQADIACEDFDKLFPPDPDEPSDVSPQYNPVEHEAVDGSRRKTYEPDSCNRGKVRVFYKDNKSGKWLEYSSDSSKSTEELNEILDEIFAKMETNLKTRRGTWSHRDSMSARDKAILEAGGKLKRTHVFDNHMAIEKVILPGNKTFIAQSVGGVSRRGEEIVDVARFWTDKLAFRGKSMGGSVVIDCSGSMQWDWQALREAVREMPSSTIALYAGVHWVDQLEIGYTKDEIVGYVQEDGVTRRKFEGKLVVIAQGGRWADPEIIMASSGFSGGNMVDYQAVQWLSRQPGPRVWLSDGQICGGLVQHWTQDERRSYFRNICRQGKIVRTTNVDAAIQFIRSRGRPGIPGVIPWTGRNLVI